MMRFHTFPGYMTTSSKNKTMYNIITNVNQRVIYYFPAFLLVVNEPCAFLENHYRSNWQRRRSPAYDCIAKRPFNESSGD